MQAVLLVAVLVLLSVPQVLVFCWLFRTMRQVREGGREQQAGLSVHPLQVADVTSWLSAGYAGVGWQPAGRS